MRPPTSSCLTDEVLVDLLEGRLPDEGLASVHRHAARCDDCRALLATFAPGIHHPGDAVARASESDDSSREPGLAWTPPEVFDEFRLEGPIGRGGMGIVFLAHDTSLDRRVAVKFMGASQPEAWVREQFASEARALARVQHANIVNVFSVGEVSGRPYIVSEYVVGQSLAELSLPVPWRRVLTLGVGLARGLAAAHRQGVLHRDLKPSNALVTWEGEVKLLDFGLAERVDAGAAPTPGSRFVAGTVPYMAPELLTGAPATPRSDIYALGLILHELCTGEVPGRPPRGSEQTPPRAPLGPDIDSDFAALITRCLATNPLERFVSAEALLEALERLERLCAPEPLVAGNPYRGLAPFEAEHRSLFFGREADIRAVLERLRSRPLVLVAGDSGAGKSSLCRAGVLPRVTAGALDDSREQTTLTLWPGVRPLEALAAALAPLLGQKEAELVTALADRPAWLGQALREAHSRGRGLLLFIDQLEELLTLSEPVQAAHFTRLLGELALPAAGVRVLLAARGDFLTRLCALPGLGDEAERGLYILRPLSPEGVREAIVGPARSQGVVFESGELVQTLVESTAHGVGSLPLLQFTLAELWERRDPARGRITREALDAMGGVAGALSRHADGVLARLSPLEYAAARRLLLQLVTAEGTRIERSEDELAEASDGASRAALRALVEGRLLHTRTVGGQPRWEIAHESLIQSWGTLRDWLDDDIGQRVLRKRVEVASAEWERLLRAREALWGQRQLEEARLLDLSILGPRERAFLLASRRAVTRERWMRRLSGGVLALAIFASGGPRLLAYLVDARLIAGELGKAREALAAGRDLAQRASVRREEALLLFDGRGPPLAGQETLEGSMRRRKAAEQEWTEALALRDEAHEAYSRASRALESALEHDRRRADTRRLIAEVTYERVLLAERFHQRRERDEWVRRLEQELDISQEGAEWLQQLQTPAELELVTTPPGAHVELTRYIEVEGALRREPVPEAGSVGPAPIARLRLPEGSYVLHVTHPGRVPVKLPLLLTHGARESIRLTLPTAVPDGYVYVPRGCFLLGSSEPEEVRKFTYYRPPIHRFCLNEGYLIGQREVTFGDWLTYLDDLPPDAPARKILEQPHFVDGVAVTLRNHPDAGWVFSLYHSSEEFRSARVGEDFVYTGRTRRNTADWRRFPLSGVSALDLEGYFYWLDRTKRLPGARLCGQYEWEYAARGADGRRYPHGDQLRPDDANVDGTYDRVPMASGPDMVGSHPASVSPFGLEDMAGNAYELTRAATPEFGRVVLRGGAWYFNVLLAASSDLSPGDPAARDARLGVRVCASFSPR